MYENKGRDTNNLKSCCDQACCYTHAPLVTFLSTKSIYEKIKLQDNYANVQHNRVTFKKCADPNTLNCQRNRYQTPHTTYVIIIVVHDS